MDKLERLFLLLFQSNIIIITIGIVLINVSWILPLIRPTSGLIFTDRIILAIHSFISLVSIIYFCTKINFLTYIIRISDKLFGVPK